MQTWTTAATACASVQLGTVTQPPAPQPHARAGYSFRVLGQCCCASVIADCAQHPVETLRHQRPSDPGLAGPCVVTLTTMVIPWPTVCSTVKPCSTAHFRFPESPGDLIIHHPVPVCGGTTACKTRLLSFPAVTSITAYPAAAC